LANLAPAPQIIRDRHHSSDDCAKYLKTLDNLYFSHEIGVKLGLPCASPTGPAAADSRSSLSPLRACG
jgi:hypothetical protein